VAEMARVLRPGGLLLLADHVEAAPWPGQNR
jgi:SAM-dependent methyltransferase